MRHLIKVLIAALRKYRIASEADGEITIAMLRALVCSDTALATALAAQTRSDVFLCRDRHSDAICWYTCCEAVRAALATASSISYCLVPEQYITWHPRAKAHQAVQRVTSVAVNARGELLMTDSEAHVIYMLTRHVPAKLSVIAGLCGKPGAAVDGVISGKAARLREPQHLAMLERVAGKEEHCYFSDVGNCTIRLIQHVQSADAKHTIATVTVRSSSSLEPYGLAVIAVRPNVVLAVAEDRRRRVLLVRMDAGGVSGSPIGNMEWTGLLAPAALTSQSGWLYVANRTNVLAADLRSTETRGTVRTTAALAIAADSPYRMAPFQDAQGLAASKDLASGCVTLYVSDCAANTIVRLLVSGSLVTRTEVIGSGVAATLGGPLATTAFNEPLGLTVQSGVLYVACYGGSDGGAVVALSPTKFGIELFQALSAMYDASGFVPPHASAARRAARHPPLQSALVTFEHSLKFLDATCRQRSDRLGGHKGLKGPDGSFYWHSIKGGQQTLRSCQFSKADLEAAAVTNAEHMTLHAFVDEGRVENGFGHIVTAATTDAPTLEVYARQLPAMQRHTLMKLASTRWSMHTGIQSHYRADQQSSISAETIMGYAERAYKAQHPERFGCVKLTPSSREQLAQERQYAQRFARLGEAQRTGTVRSFFKGRCGFGPTLLLPARAPTGAAVPRNFPSYRERLRELMRRGGAGDASSSSQASLVTRETHKYHEGDILVLLAGAADRFWVHGLSDADSDDEGASGGHGDGEGAYCGSSSELWWLIQCTRAVKRTAIGPKCLVHSFWLKALHDEIDAEDELQHWALLSGVAVNPIPRLENLLLDPSTQQPFVIRAEELPSGWSVNQQQVYTLSAELIGRLDAAAAAVHGAIEAGSESEGEVDGAAVQNGRCASEPGSDSDDDDATRLDLRDEQRRSRDGLRQTCLREILSAQGATRRPVVSVGERRARIAQIGHTLSTYRADFLQTSGQLEMTSEDWPASLRRLLKESQQLIRTLQAEGYAVSYID